MASRRKDGIWQSRIDIPGPKGSMRYSVNVFAATEEAVLAKRDEFLAGERFATLSEIRAAGSHTHMEWGKLRRANSGSNRLLVVCSYCRREVYHLRITRDHMVPMARGGSDTIDNITPACVDCNRKKRQKTDAEFRRMLAGG